MTTLQTYAVCVLSPAGVFSPTAALLAITRCHNRVTAAAEVAAAEARYLAAHGEPSGLFRVGVPGEQAILTPDF
jgi:hypothetical protein